MPNTSNSQKLTVSNTAAVNADWTQHFEWILVVNETTVPVWVATDGSAATVANGNDVCLPGQQAMFPSRQPKQEAISTAPGSTAQKITVPASGSLTFVSVIAETAPGTNTTVLVSPQ